MHRRPDPEAPSTAPIAGAGLEGAASERTAGRQERPNGSLNAAISDAVVHIFRDHLGRGPTKTRTSIRDNLVIVVLEDTLTKAERTLVVGGQEEVVLEIRRKFQMTMREALTRPTATLAPGSGKALRSAQPAFSASGARRSFGRGHPLGNNA